MPSPSSNEANCSGKDFASAAENRGISQKIALTRIKRRDITVGKTVKPQHRRNEWTLENCTHISNPSRKKTYLKNKILNCIL